MYIILPEETFYLVKTYKQKRIRLNQAHFQRYYSLKHNKGVKNTTKTMKFNHSESVFYENSTQNNRILLKKDTFSQIMPRHFNVIR